MMLVRFLSQISHKKIALACALLVTVAQVPLVCSAEEATKTASERRLGSFLQYRSLKKITVGPEDNYQASLDPSGQQIYFTEKLNFAPQVMALNLATAKKVAVIKGEGDADQPVVSPDGHRLAFRYFKNDARGEVCLWSFLSNFLQCLSLPEGERYSPFWVDNTHVGFLLREPGAQKVKLMVANLENQNVRSVYEGFISAPVAFHTSQKILVTESLPSEDKNWFSIFSLNGGSPQNIFVNVQGRSGFPTLTPDDKYIYFAQFISDTNNDQRIDASDRGVIYRMPAPEQTVTEALQPLQITSLEQNCSYPQAQKELYLTCDFEGSLDIYRLPLTGVIPPDWDAKTLWNAHETARSIEERLLLLNHIQAKSPNSRTGDLMLRYLSDYFFIEDDESTLFLLSRLKVSTPPLLDQADLQWTESMVELWQAWKRNLSKLTTGAFQAKVLSLQRRSQTLPKDSIYASLFAAQLENIYQRPSGAVKKLNLLLSSKFNSPWQAQVYFRVLKNHLDAQEKITLESLRLFLPLLTSPQLTRDQRLAFAFFAGLYADQSSPAVKAAMNAQFRDLSLKNGKPELIEFFESEIGGTALAEATDEKQKVDLWRSLDKRLTQYRDDYFMRRVLGMRLVHNLAAAQDYVYLGYAASAFQRYVLPSSTEYNYATRFLISVLLDKGYYYLAQKKLTAAYGAFYGAAVSTEDLESHYQFIKTNTAAKEYGSLEKAYQNMKTNQFVGRSLPFVDAVLALFRPDGEVDYDEVIQRLESMSDDQSGIRYLVLGFAYMKKLQQKKPGEEFNAAIGESANRSLVLSLDLSRENPRVRAAALENLGVLHHLLKNYGLSARYFEMRAQRPFVDFSPELAVRWWWSKSLFHVGDETKALEVLTSLADRKELSDSQRRAVNMQLGFLATSNQSYEQAIVHFDKLLPVAKVLSPDHQIKLHLMYGLALLRTKKIAESLPHFDFILAQSPASAKAFVHTRATLNALGLKAQALEELKQKAAAVQTLEIRENKLLAIKGSLAELKIQDEAYFEEVLKNRIRLCTQAFTSMSSPQRVNCLERSWLLAKDYYDNVKQDFSNTAFKTLESLFLLSEIAKVNLEPKLAGQISQKMKDYVSIANKIKVKPPVLLYQIGKIDLYSRILDSEAAGKKLSPSDLANQFLSIKDLEPKLYQRAQTLKQEILKTN